MLEAHHPVVIFANGNGDHLLNLPALRALTTLFPNRLTLICRPGARRLFFSDLSLRTVCEVEMQKTATGRMFDADTVARRIGPCDLLLSLNPWHSPAIDRLLELLAPAVSIGFFPAFQTALPRDYSKHSSELAFDIPRYFDASLRIEDFADPPVLPAESIRQAQALRAMVPKSLRVMAVHADTQAEKMWPAHQFVTLLDIFLERHPDFVIFVVGCKNLHLDAGQFGDHVIPCYGLSLAVSLALIQETELFLGIDSCMLHAADIFRVPGVGLFGPTECHEFGFRFGHHRHVYGDGTMQAICVTQVLNALESLEEERGRITE